jgi:hypothetical protein
MYIYIYIYMYVCMYVYMTVPLEPGVKCKDRRLTFVDVNLCVLCVACVLCIGEIMCVCT